MQDWLLYGTENEGSQLVSAVGQVPQTITVYGKKVAVLMSVSESQRDCSDQAVYLYTQSLESRIAA